MAKADVRHSTRRDFLHLTGLATGAAIGMAVLPGAAMPVADPPQPPTIATLFAEWWPIWTSPEWVPQEHFDAVVWPRASVLEEAILAIPPVTAADLAMQFIVISRDHANIIDDDEYDRHIRAVAGVSQAVS